MYKELVDAFNHNVDYSERAVKDAAVKFAESQNPEDRNAFLLAKKQQLIWETARAVVTNRGGRLARLVDPKEVK